MRFHGCVLLILLLLVNSVQADVWRQVSGGASGDRVYELSLQLTGSNVSFTTPNLAGTIDSIIINKPTSTTRSVINISDNNYALLNIYDSREITSPIQISKNYNNINMVPNTRTSLSGWGIYKGAYSGTITTVRGTMTISQTGTSSYVYANYPVYLYKNTQYIAWGTIRSSSVQTYAYYGAYVNLDNSTSLYPSTVLGLLVAVTDRNDLPQTTMIYPTQSSFFNYTVFNGGVANSVTWATDMGIRPVTYLEQSYVINSPLYLTFGGSAGTVLVRISMH